MFFSMDDFDNDNYYSDVDSNVDDSDFIESLMVLSNILKNTNFTSNMKDSSHFMMKIFNVSQLDVDEKNEPALNLIIGLIMHIYALMGHVQNKEEYFNFIDENVILPLLKGNTDE